LTSLKFSLVVSVLLALAVAASAADNDAAPSGWADAHLFDSPNDVKWGPAPPVVPKGAQAAVLDGDPFKDGSSYTLRLKMPDGYKIPPHWHPMDENVTVLSGTLGAGMGDTFDTAKGQLMNVLRVFGTSLASFSTSVYQILSSLSIAFASFRYATAAGVNTSRGSG
jgi:hypothetical protein